MKSDFTTIKEFPNYEINSDSIVRNKKTLKIMSQYIGSTGYYMVTLRGPGLHKPRKVHRLLAMAFIPNPNSLPEVNHLDGNKLNNAIPNLEWTTHRANMEHALRTGLYDNSGIKNGMAKLTESQVKRIKKMLRDGKLSQYEIANRIGGISRSCVMNIKNRGQWGHIEI